MTETATIADIPPAVVEAIAARAAALALEQARDRQEWFTVREAATYLRMPVDSLKKITAARGIAVHRDSPGGRRTYLRRADLDAFRERHQEPALDTNPR